MAAAPEVECSISKNDEDEDSDECSDNDVVCRLMRMNERDKFHNDAGDGIKVN